MSLDRVIGFGGNNTDYVIFTKDCKEIVFPSHYLVVAMEIFETRRQKIFIGHTENVCVCVCVCACVCVCVCVCACVCVVCVCVVCVCVRVCVMSECCKIMWSHDSLIEGSSCYRCAV